MLDWLGDTGGLGEALFFIGGAFLVIFQYGQFDAMLIRYLYRIRPSKDGGGSQGILKPENDGPDEIED